MARHKHPSGQEHCANNDPALTKDGDIPPVATASYQNGAALSPDREIKQRTILAILSYLMENRAVAGAIFAALGLGGGAAAALLPVRHAEFDQFRTEIKADVQVLKDKVETHDVILQRVEDNTTKILFKLSDHRPVADPAPITPASSPPPEKPKPKAKRHHPQRVGLFQRLTR